jgi:hypothetical protein
MKSHSSPFWSFFLNFAIFLYLGWLFFYCCLDQITAQFGLEALNPLNPLLDAEL